MAAWTLGLRSDWSCLWRWVCLLVLCGVPAGGHAQQLAPDPALRGVLIWDAAVDPAGWLWLATDRGGYRYDGQHLVPLHQLVRFGPTLPTGTLRAVVRDAQGSLWWGGAGGLWQWQPHSGRLRAIPLPQHTAKRLGVTALGLRHGRLWIGRDADPFTIYSLSITQPGAGARQEARYPQGWATGFAPDSAGQWHALGTRVALPLDQPARRPPQRFSENQHGQLLRPDGSTTWLPPGGRLLLPGTAGRWQLRAGGLYEAVPGRSLRRVEAWSWNSSEVARVLRVVELDSTWFWSAGEQVLSLSLRGLSRGQRPHLQRRRTPLVFGRELELVPLPDGRTLLGFRFDGPGAVRLATTGRAAEPLLTRPARALSTRALGRLPDGRRFVSSYQGLWVQPADSPTARLRLLASSQQAGIWFATLPLPGGRLLLANEVGHFEVWQNGRRQRLLWSEPHPALAETNGLCLLRDQAGRYWGGSVAGLFAIDVVGGQVRRYHNADPRYPLHHLRIEALAEGSPGTLWIATSQGLYRLTLASGALVRYGPNEPGPRRLPTADVRSLVSTHPDSLWLGTFDQGLLLLHPRRGLRQRLSLGQGLPSESVSFLMRWPADARALWLGTYHGLVRYEPATGRLQHLTLADGLAAEECNRQSVGWDARTGELLVGGVGGASRVHLRQVAHTSAQQPPRLLLSALTQHHAATGRTRTTYPMAGTLPALCLAPGDAFVDLQLTLADYAPLAHPRYAYRLRGTGADAGRWLSLGHTGTLHLQQLKPGRYHLQLRGETSAGLAADHLLTLPLVVQQPWQRHPGTWALGALLLAAAVGGGVYGLQRYRAAQLRAEHQLRARLAADLHDEVGNLLTRVTLRAELARELPEPILLDELLTESRAAAATVRDLVWTVDTDADTAGALADRLQDLLTQSATAANRTAHFGCGPEPFPADAALRPDVRQHVYLIGREALTNALKYAPAGAGLSLRLTVSAAELCLDVSQGGRATGDGPVSRAGQGLRNLFRRAQLLGGTLTAGPTAGASWQVQLRVPKPLR